MSKAVPPGRAGDAAWAKMDKIVCASNSARWSTFFCCRVHSCVRLLSLQSAELFTMTYGALVVQMLKDYEDVDAVNVELDKMYA